MYIVYIANLVVKVFIIFIVIVIVVASRIAFSVLRYGRTALPNTGVWKLELKPYLVYYVLITTSEQSVLNSLLLLFNILEYY